MRLIYRLTCLKHLLYSYKVNVCTSGLNSICTNVTLNCYRNSVAVNGCWNGLLCIIPRPSGAGTGCPPLDSNLTSSLLVFSYFSGFWFVLENIVFFVIFYAINSLQQKKIFLSKYIVVCPKVLLCCTQ